jgi:type I restriction enzyme S subunit
MAEPRTSSPSFSNICSVDEGNFNAEENKALVAGENIGDTPTVQAKDLLISRANTVQLVGAVVLVERDHPNLMLSDKTLRLVPSSSSISKSFLLHALRTRTVRDVFEEDATGTSDSMRNLSQEKIRSAPIPLPPEPEALIVANRLTGAIQERREISGRLKEITEQLIVLDRALLSKAFRGELVAQDPNDDPAEAMLAGMRGVDRDASNGSAIKTAKNRGAVPTLETDGQ